jgi:hypothetical protein
MHFDQVKKFLKFDLTTIFFVIFEVHLITVWLINNKVISSTSDTTLIQLNQDARIWRWILRQNLRQKMSWKKVYRIEMNYFRSYANSKILALA